MEKQVLTSSEVQNKLLRLNGETGDIDFRNTEIRGVRFAGLIEALSDNTIKDAIFDDAILVECDFTDVYFEDCEFQRARIVNAEGTTTFQGCDFYEARIAQSNFAGAVFNHCGVESLIIDQADFKGSIWKNCIALGLVGTQVDFSESEFDDVQFEGAKFNESQFYDAGFYNSPLSVARYINRCIFDGVSKRSDFDVASVGDVGAEESSIHYFPSDNKVFIGNWKGELDELIPSQTEYVNSHMGDDSLFSANDLKKLDYILPYFQHLKTSSEERV